MSNMLIALQITALGMGLVFAAIILLWWMMSLLTAVTADKQTASATAEPPSGTMPAPIMGNNIRAQAAAIAVAMALAEQQISHAHPLSDAPTAIVSAWQLGMRTRQMYQKGRPLVRNPRKVG